MWFVKLLKKITYRDKTWYVKDADGRMVRNAERWDAAMQSPSIRPVDWFRTRG